jgi:acyl-coenzyme A thioesterase PaaI-like protein
VSEERDAHVERTERARRAAREATGVWAAKRELAAALRELVAQVPGTAAGEAELRALAPLVREAVARFAAAGRATAKGDTQVLYAGMENFLETGPLAGFSNPLSPPLEFRIDREARVVRGRGRFGPAYEGAPGVVHGGFVAAALDEILGLATVFSGGPGMTRELTVRYLRPTPIDVDLELVARFDRAEGRRIFCSAEVEAAGVRTAEAVGLFTGVGGEKFAALDQARRERLAKPRS